MRKLSIRRVLAMVPALVVPLATAPAAAASPAHHLGYFSGDYLPSLEMYSFNLNLNAAIKGRKGVPPITTVDAIKWAASAGFPAVDITAYYLPGYDTHTMPTVPTADIMAYADRIRALTQQLGVAISGTGVFNDFADPDTARRALDIRRVEFWTDIAARMGAPVMRVFSGKVPADIGQYGWADITRTRIVPALREVTAYAATKGVKIVLQNHGDMAATADQTLRMLDWVDSRNISVIDDTGYFRPFQAETGLGYDWYPDIARTLARSDSIQVKQLPAGEGTDVPMDLDRLCTDMRLSSYRGFIPLELLWVAGQPGYPRDLPTPPFDQITAFKTKVDTALAETKTEPFDVLRNDLRTLAGSGDVAGPVRGQLHDLLGQADGHYREARPGHAIARMRDFLNRVANPGPRSHLSEIAEQQLTRRMSALLTSFTDVFGGPPADPTPAPPDHRGAPLS
ncbi:sugar phosphate isomerase/epimerase family protein [Amycolatopsis mediterranei]|uniref:sugar phosphate isomerase/epimerase family protein n=1 Tax=Amycolatopsis mediterranei TaxID=33910 RepID=UPI00342443D6